MALTLAILVLAILVTANYRFRPSVVYPPFIFCAMWLFDLVIYRLNIVDIYPLHTITLIVVCVGALVFSLGGTVAFVVPGVLIRTRITLIGQPKVRRAWIRYLMILALAAGIIFTLRVMYEIAASAGGMHGLFFAVARNEVVREMNAGHESSHWYSYVGTWSIYAAVLFQAERSDWTAWLITLVSFLSNVMSGGRGGLLFLFAALTCLYLIKTGREKLDKALRMIRWPILLFFSLFISLTLADRNTSTTGGAKLGFAAEALVDYIIGPTRALDYVLRHPSEYLGSPNHTFQFFLRIASWLGLISYTPPPTLDKYIFIPFGTNVYTVYKFYFVDFGLIATIMIMAIVGFVHVLLYRKAHTKSTLGLYLFSLSMYSVLMVIFDDAYARFGMYLDAFLIGSIYFTMKSLSGRLWRVSTDGEISLSEGDGGVTT